MAFLDYILENWRAIGDEYAGKEASAQLNLLRVKVNETNVGSLKLFDSLGFGRVGEGANYFGEIEMRWKPDREALRASKGWERSEAIEYLLQ